MEGQTGYAQGFLSMQFIEQHTPEVLDIFSVQPHDSEMDYATAAMPTYRMLFAVDVVLQVH